MSFECGLFMIPKFGDITPKEALAAFEYGQYKKGLKDEWHQSMIAQGVSFHFDDYNCFKTGDLPSDEVLNKYVEYCDAGNERKYFATACSTGRKINSELVGIGERITKSGEYVYYDKDAVREMRHRVVSWLDSHRLKPVSLGYAYKYNKDGTITGYDVDGIEAEFEGGLMRRLDSEGEDCLFAFPEYTDIDDYEIHTYFKEAAEEILCDVDLNRFFVYYYVSD